MAKKMKIHKRKDNRKYGGELAFEGFERQLYCWIKQRRSMCALHKVIYYKFDDHILEDKQYDYIENMLEVVENRHKEISDAVTAEGYLSPQDYVDALEDDVLYSRAVATLRTWEEDGRKPVKSPMIMAHHTDEVLYEAALESIKKYPI